MDWLRKKKEKSKNRKGAHGALLTPTASASASSVANLETNANNPAPSDIQHEKNPIGVTTEHTTPSVISTEVDNQMEQTHRGETARGSRTDRWLSRAAFLLNLTKSAADAGGLAPLKGACEGAVTLLDAFQDVKDNRSAWSDLLRSVQAQAAAFQKQLHQLGIDDVIKEVEESISAPITEYLAALTELVADICAESGLEESEFNERLTLKILVQRIGTTKLEANVIADYERRLKETEWRIMCSMMTYVTISVNASNDADVLKPLEFKQQRQRPDPCHPGTRAEILAACVDWANDDSASNILWIKAVPGAGKTAIMSSLIDLLGDSNERLLCGYFFYRQDSTTSTTSGVWQNAAYRLARHPTIRKDLVEKLKKDQIDLTTPDIGKLFRQLIEEPLSKIRGIPVEHSPIIIIDALDECGGLEGSRSKERQRLMATLGLWSKLPSNFKLIVSSREEDDIARTFRQNPPVTINLAAGKATEEQSKRDIQAFLAQKLGEIVKEYSTLPVGWPGPQVLESLAIKANGLFIWASTVVNYIAAGPPKPLLEDILRGERMGDMDQLYMQVLDTALPGPRVDVKRDARAILGAIVVAKQTLDVTIFSKLLSIELSTAEHICKRLGSVLENEGGVKFRHQSFVDFLLTSEESAYSLKIPACEEALAVQCLSALKDGLRFNICDISSSHLSNDEILKTITALEDYIPRHLQYASQHWVAHLQNAPYSEAIVTSIRYFLKVQLLSWLEVASFCRFMDETSAILLLLVKWLKLHDRDDLIPLAADMSRFIAHFGTVVSESVPHIYLSALPFAPPSSEVRKQYEDQYPNTMRVEIGGYHTWSPLLTTLAGYYDGHSTVAISPNGKKIAFGCSDETVRIWDTDTGEQLGASLRGHTGWIQSIAFFPDGRRIVSGSSSGTIRIWDVDTGKQLGASLEGHRGRVTSVAFPHDGRLIVSGSDDKTVRVWNADTGKQLGASLEGHGACVSSVAFSPDGRRIVSGSEDNTLQIWDVDTGKQLGASLEGHTRWVNSVAFLPDGRRIVSGSSDETIRIWDADTGKQLGESLYGHKSSVRSVASSADGRRIVSGSQDERIRIWDVDTGKQLGASLKGHSGWVTSVAFPHDGRLIVSGSDDKTVRVWDADTSKHQEASLEGHSACVTSVAFSPDGRRIVSGSEDNKLRLWDADTGKQLGATLEGHSGWVSSVAFSPDGRRIVSGSEDTTLRIWDADSGKQLGTPLKGHGRWVTSVAFPRDGQLIVSGSDDKTVRMWNADTGKQLGASLDGHSACVSSVAFSPDGRRIVSGAYDCTLRIWDVNTGKQVGVSLEGHRGSVSSVSFSPDGRRILSGSHDWTVRIWDADIGKQLGASLEGHSGWVSSVAFSPDGRRIASGSKDNTLQVWDADSGTQLGPSLEGHADWVRSVAFSPDSRRIVSGSADKTIRVWDIVQGNSAVPGPSHTCAIADGWLVTSAGERLCWIPEPFRIGLGRQGLLVLGLYPKTNLNMTNFVHGEDWTKVKEGGRIPEAV